MHAECWITLLQCRAVPKITLHDDMLILPLVRWFCEDRGANAYPLIRHGNSCPLSWGWKQGWELPAVLQALRPLTPSSQYLGAALTGHTDVPVGLPIALLAPCSPASLIVNFQGHFLFIPILTLMKNQ